MAEVDTSDLHFVRWHPRDATKRHWGQIQLLRYAHYRGIFSDRATEEMGRFVGSTTRAKWNSPNRAVGHGLREGQRFSRSRVVAAFDEHQNVVGYAYGANNASSARPGLEGSAERMALHIPSPRLREGRYVWFREVVQGPEEREGLLPVMVGLMLDNYENDQPATVYPRTEEVKFKEDMGALGFASDGSAPEQVFPFGDGSRHTFQERWVAPSVGAVRDNILAIEGVSRAISRAHANML